MAQNFTDAVADWANQTEVQQTAVLHEALRQLDGEIVENTPVVTGNLKNSRTVSALGRPAVDWKTKNFRDPSDAINNAIAGVEVGRTAWLGYRAPYAHKVEEKRGFLRLAAQRWQQIVESAARVISGGGR